MIVGSDGRGVDILKHCELWVRVEYGLLGAAAIGWFIGFDVIYEFLYRPERTTWRYIEATERIHDVVVVINMPYEVVVLAMSVTSASDGVRVLHRMYANMI